MLYRQAEKEDSLFDMFRQYSALSHSLPVSLQDLLRGESLYTVAEHELYAAS